MPTDEHQNAELSDEQIDSLVSEAETPSNSEVPMTAADVKAPEQKTEAELMFEFQHNGKPIKANRDQIVKYAQMGYDYPQKMAQFNQQRQAFEAQQKEFETKYAPYQQVNEWAEKNPTEWQRLEQLYRQAQSQPQAAQIDPNIAPALQKYEQQLGEVTSFMQTLKQEKEQASRKEQDSALENEMKSIRESYKDLDFDTPNEEGKSLDYQVLEHAKVNGIRSFKTAFRDFYHDKLVEREVTLAKQDVSKNIQKNSKLGVLGARPTQSQTYSQPKNISQQSYEDLAQEALAELRAGS